MKQSIRIEDAKIPIPVLNVKTDNGCFHIYQNTMEGWYGKKTNSER